MSQHFHKLVLFSAMGMALSVSVARPDDGVPSDSRYVLTVPSSHFGSYELVNVDLAGQVSRLGTGPLRGDSPAWSPDGTLLAFSRHRKIEVANADGTNVRTVAEGIRLRFPCWSPDGRRIAFEIQEKNGMGDIAVVDFASGDIRRLTNRPDQIDLWPAWSPDGKRIAFGSERDGRAKLFTMKPDGSDVRLLVKRPGYYWLCPAWSPDGHMVAFGRLQDLYVSDRSGKMIRQLTRTGRDEAALYPAWSPDGRYLSWAHYKDWPQDPQDTSARVGDLVVMDVVKETRTVILPQSLPRYGGRAAWKPFGNPRDVK